MTSLPTSTPDLIPDDTADSLRRIAAALERLAPAGPTPMDLSGGVFFTLDPKCGAATAAPLRVQPLDLLVGIEAQKTLVVAALQRFGQGLPVNHLLLWGARGTGKSSLLKSAAAAQAARTPAFRLVEIDRDHIEALPELLQRLRPLPYRILVFCDDLSFEAGASAAKSLKSALEGGVAEPPDNVLFAATSNRRHLAPERHDEAGGLLAAAEQAEETVSVSDRFGLWIGFPPMDQAGYLAAVRGYAERHRLDVADLDRRALQWSARRGGRSGRVAWQFIRDLAGEQGVRL